MLLAQGLIESILEVFSLIAQWFIDAVSDLTAVFWTPDTGLSLLGFMAVISVGFGVIMLILGIIQNFLGFRS